MFAAKLVRPLCVAQTRPYNRTVREANKNSLWNRSLNVVFKGAVLGFVTLTFYAVCDILMSAGTDPSGGRLYAPPTWPPPPEERNQKHPKWTADAKTETK